MQVSISVNTCLLILLKVNLDWPNTGFTLDELIDYFHLPHYESWRNQTGDLAQKMPLVLQCLADLQHSEILED